VGWINVAAATGRHSVAETLELDRQAQASGQPAAIVGGLPAAASAAETIALIDEQMAASGFRGVRPMNPKGPPVPDDDVLRALVERDLVFELMAHPPDLADAARRLAAHPELTVVVEHTGWPRSTDEDERVLWLDGIGALARAGHNVHCKLSGLAMPLGAMSAAAFRPWLEPAIEAFGVDRCLFASNFPVDGLHGTLDELWTASTEVVAGLDDETQDRLFAANAESLYRC
jgi:predicted TIM-barrel fold metal-dependent hydrolase